MQELETNYKNTSESTKDLREQLGQVKIAI